MLAPVIPRKTHFHTRYQVSAQFTSCNCVTVLHTRRPDQAPAKASVTTLDPSITELPYLFVRFTMRSGGRGWCGKDPQIKDLKDSEVNGTPMNISKLSLQLPKT